MIMGFPDDVSSALEFFKSLRDGERTRSGSDLIASGIVPEEEAKGVGWAGAGMQHREFNLGR